MQQNLNAKNISIQDIIDTYKQYDASEEIKEPILYFISELTGLSIDAILELIRQPTEKINNHQTHDRYVFIFDYTGGWMILCFENENNEKYFNSAEDGWDDALDYADMFLKNGGTKYYYQLPSYDLVKDLDIFNLKNQPEEKLKDFLLL